MKEEESAAKENKALVEEMKEWASTTFIQMEAEEERKLNGEERKLDDEERKSNEKRKYTTLFVV